MSALEAQYLRLLRWYPQAWRARNSAAVVGVLLDQAENEGRITPSSADRRSLILGGLQERMLRPARPSVSSVAALAAAIVFALWYVVVIAGSLADPVLISAGVLVLAAGAAVLRRPQLVALLSLLAAASAVVSALSEAGPGPSPTILLVGLCVLAAAPALRRSEFVALGFAALFASVCASAVRLAIMTLPVWINPQFWSAVVVAVIAGAGAMLLIAIVVARRASARPRPAA